MCSLGTAVMWGWLFWWWPPLGRPVALTLPSPAERERGGLLLAERGRLLLAERGRLLWERGTSATRVVLWEM